MAIIDAAKGWVRELGETVFPRALFLPGLPKAGPIRIHIGQLPLDEPTRVAAREARRPVLAVIGSSLCLKRTLELPSAVGAQAESAIALQLRQTFPGQGQGIIWRAKRLRRVGLRILYEIYILKEAQLDEVLSSLSGLGAKVDSVVIAGASGAPIWPRQPVDKIARTWAAFSALTVSVIGLITVTIVERERQSLDDLVASRSARVEALEARVRDKAAAAVDGSGTTANVLSDMQLFWAQSRPLRHLTDLTEALPDTVWVSELAVSGEQLIFSGFVQGDVSEVIRIVQALPWTSDVRLNGTVSFDSVSGQNRFELALNIVADIAQ